MWLQRFLPLEYRRKQLLAHCRPGALRDYLACSFPGRNSDYRDIPVLAVDLETTGLDSQHDHILSIGMVEVDRQGIRLASARHILVHSPRELPADTVVIHKLTDDMVASGVPAREAISMLLEKLQGKVLLAHHASIETGFIRQACQQFFGCDWLAPVIDTQQLAVRRIRRSDSPPVEGQFRLDSLRQHFGLPAYAAHNALADAIATAELFLAEMAGISGDHGRVSLKDLLSRY